MFGAGDTVVIIILVILTASVIIKMISDKKSGKNTCFGDCAGCKKSCQCNNSRAIEKESKKRRRENKNV